MPQIFIKEATIVRRSLIHEVPDGIPLKLPPSTSDMVKGVEGFPAIYGMVLTTPKKSPQVEMPIVAGKNNDPVLAHWQTGLGRAAVFTSDAHNRWLAGWVGWMSGAGAGARVGGWRWGWRRGAARVVGS